MDKGLAKSHHKVLNKYPWLEFHNHPMGRQISITHQDLQPPDIKGCVHAGHRGIGEMSGERFLCESPVGQLGSILSEKLQNALVNLSAFSWVATWSLAKTGRA